jgi:2-desacetyl-2-hydroxyethyl bacteriochlorophyllide A dehydrogenase
VKAVRASEGGVAVVDVDEPPGMGDQVLDIKATSICASDLSYIEWGMRLLLGHELAGMREDGTAVVVEGIYGCGTCEWCQQGANNLCPTHPERALGVSLDGGMVEHYRVPSTSLVEVPAGLDVRDACLVEPASVSWHALRLAGTGRGTRVAIVGAGALGLLAISDARTMGAEEVHIEARHPHQKEAAERLGARVGTDGEYDVVLEAAGSVEAMARAAQLVRRAGSIVSVGVFPGPLEIDWMTMFTKEARLIPSLGYCTHEDGREMDHVAQMLADDPEIAKTVITHRFPIEDAPEAFRVASDRASGSIRVVIEP